MFGSSTKNESSTTTDEQLDPEELLSLEELLETDDELEAELDDCEELLLEDLLDELPLETELDVDRDCELVSEQS